MSKEGKRERILKAIKADNEFVGSGFNKCSYALNEEKISKRKKTRSTSTGHRKKICRKNWVLKSVLKNNCDTFLLHSKRLQYLHPRMCRTFMMLNSIVAHFFDTRKANVQPHSISLYINVYISNDKAAATMTVCRVYRQRKHEMDFTIVNSIPSAHSTYSQIIVYNIESIWI